MTLYNFDSLEFPAPQGTLPLHVVYVFCARSGEGEIPFYVGQTGRFSGRMNDYRLACFAAATDFRVGEAAKYLKSSDFHIFVKYKPVEAIKRERLRQEGALIKAFKKSGTLLLNDFPSYNYRTADKFEQKASIQGFCKRVAALVRKPT